MEFLTEVDYEYIPESSSTMRFQKLPDIDPEFERELVKIAGLNPHGKPNLRVVKGNEIESDRAEERCLKYSCGWTPFEVQGYSYRDADGEHFTTNVDNLDPSIFIYPVVRQQELGLLRYVIERWVSPEELERANRFQKRDMDGKVLLREFPREGIYDCYQIIENTQGKFRKLDKDVLYFLKARWQFDHKTDAEKEAIRDQQEYEKKLADEKYLDELWRGAMAFDLKLPIEERERREEYWRKKTDWDEDAKRVQGTATFYPQ